MASTTITYIGSNNTKIFNNSSRLLLKNINIKTTSENIKLINSEKRESSLEIYFCDFYEINLSVYDINILSIKNSVISTNIEQRFKNIPSFNFEQVDFIYKFDGNEAIDNENIIDVQSSIVNKFKSRMFININANVSNGNNFNSYYFKQTDVKILDLEYYATYYVDNPTKINESLSSNINLGEWLFATVTTA